ncbi:class I adenylate-forming enzyme family protein [Emcibacter nanhaiensis]|nr:class I adenylate-forming enzyme family protein [Emcibacter nanhaiensis]
MPEFACISDYVTWYAEKTPSAEACVFNGSRVTYAQLELQVERLACAYIAAGVSKGDRVAVLATTSPDFLVSFLAVARIGAIWVGLNAKYKRDELLYVVSDCKPKILLARTRIGERQYDEDIKHILSEVSGIEKVVLLDDANALSGAVSYRDFLHSGENILHTHVKAPSSGGGDKKPCLIVYTSGSTGKPKGALLHQQGIIRFCLEQNRIWYVNPHRVINFLPINHVGCVVDLSLPAVLAGGTQILCEKFDPVKMLELVEREKVTLWASVPSTFIMQLGLPDFDKYDLASVQLIAWGGAAMPEETVRRLVEVCPRMSTNYAMTETLVTTVVEPTDNVEALTRTVGHPFPGVELRLVDDRGNDVDKGEPGELLVRSVYNMLGYWNRPEASKEAFLGDGWFRTGDVLAENRDGSFSVVGRLKEMYKSGGYNVYPKEVEAAIETCPGIVEAAVVSVPDPKWQEVGIAYVTLRQSCDWNEEGLRSFCSERLANYKMPKKFLCLPEMPLLPIGKVDKVALKKMAVLEYGATKGGAEK